MKENEQKTDAIRERQRPELALLDAKGIHPRDSFVIFGNPDRYFTITKAGYILDLDGIRIPFTENDIWEQFEQIERISRARFEQAAEERRERLWRERGQPGKEELFQMTERFLSSYADHPEGQEWRWICAHEEETLLRIAELAVDMLAKGNAEVKRRLFRTMYRDMVVAKAMLGRRE